MQLKPTVTIVLPCFNPVDGWMVTIEKSLAKVQDQNINTQLIIVNDGSTKNFDNVKAINFFSKHPQVKIISYVQNRGKGYALRQGVKEALSDIIVYTDIDFPYTHQSFLKILGAMQNNSCDVAVGIRSEDYYTHLPAIRVRISKLLRFVVRTFLRIPTDDTQCGLKGFNKKGKEVFLQTTIDRYLFDLEFIFLAARKKVNLKTIEVELREGVQLSHMRWNILLQEFGNFLKIFAQSIF
jgi:glycosyltransferase involved in cell wall biosynthesis